jgi:aldehyde:ferredoxin oxidoreductase
MPHLAGDPSSLPGGIMGRLLRVDLSTRECRVETLEPRVARMWIGGTGLGAKILYDEVPPGVEWDDPANRLIIAAGPLAGTKVHGAGTYSAVTRGPMTNLLGATQANGFFGSYLKQNGYDAIILQGQASEWLYLFIAEGVLELRTADHLMGKDTWETEHALLAELGYKQRLLSVHGIGPAGENLVRFAVIGGDQGHIAAHNGVGAVMGSKRLKCIAVARGKQAVPVAHPERLNEYAEALFEHAYEFRDRWLARGGTAVGLSDMHALGSLPVRNYQTNVFPEHEAMNGLTFRENFDGKHTPCWACRMNHLHTGCMTTGRKKGYFGEEPEYEGFAAFGPQVGITDQSAAFWLSNLADRYGVDLNEAGWLFGWVLECVERGILDRDRDLDGLQLKWDDEDSLAELLRKISLREGCGAWLAKGSCAPAGTWARAVRTWRSSPARASLRAATTTVGAGRSCLTRAWATRRRSRPPPAPIRSTTCPSNPSGIASTRSTSAASLARSTDVGSSTIRSGCVVSTARICCSSCTPSTRSLAWTISRWTRSGRVGKWCT